MSERTRAVRYVAVWGEQPAHADDSLEVAVDGVVDDLQGALDAEDVEPESVESEPMTVYVDCTLCLGAPDVEDCACGMDHDYEDGWRLMSWKRSTSVRLAVEVPVTDYEGYAVVPMDEVSDG
jgi:hypothetical protein